MSITRRRVLMGATALTAAALTRRFATRPDAVPLLTAPGEGAAVTVNVLVLHDGGAAGRAFAQRVHASTSACVADRAVAVLTLEGFKQVGALLDNLPGGTVVALLNDAQTVVVDALLKERNAVELDRRRYGRQVLLTARV